MPCMNPKEKMDDLVLMLRGAMAAEGKVGLKLNVRRAELERVAAEAGGR